MAFGGFENKSHQTPIAEINTTPLVDVMLVLLVIFIITAPLFTNAVKLDLPKTDTVTTPPAPNIVTIAIDANDHLFWNNEPVDLKRLKEHLQIAARTNQLPELHIRADKNSRYDSIAQVMAAAQHVNLQRIGFVTEPTP